MDWTVEEEKGFAELMAEGNLERLEAIRLYRRFRGDMKRALKYACEMAEGNCANRERARERVKRVSPVAETAQIERLSVIQGSA